MRVLVANATGFEAGRLATLYPDHLGHLYSPGGQRGPWDWMPYALDNGAFPAFQNKTPWSEEHWRRLLNWAALSGQRPLWVLVPDVVADREQTIARWHQYAPDVLRFGWRPGFALQDGMTFEDVPSRDCMLFVGGGDKWKEAAIGPWCARFPGRVHVGRVTTWRRLWKCYQAGAVSVDGTRWFTKKGGQAAELRRFLEHVSGERKVA